MEAEMKKRFTMVLIMTLILLAGCFETEGGKNTNEEKPGNREGGNIALNLSLSPDGRFIVRGKRTLSFDIDYRTYEYDFLLRILDTQTGKTAKISFVTKKDIEYRMVFGKNENIYMVTDEKAISEFDLATGRMIKKWDVPAAGKMELDRNDTLLATWKGGYVSVIDTVSNQIHWKIYNKTVTDVKWLPLSKELAIVYPESSSSTKVIIAENKLNEVKRISVPNCSSTLEISPDGSVGMIAPQSCTIDPVSIIDLEKHTFVKNVPGFGPVAFSPDGKYAVAFGRQEDLEREAGIITQTSYSILFIDMKKFSFEVMELGGEIPVYTVTPDGELVLIYGGRSGDYYSGILAINVDSRELRYTTGNSVELTEFVMTPDSRHVFLIDDDLFYLLETATLEVIEIELNCRLHYINKHYCAADEIMISPKGDEIILGMVNEIDFALFDPESLKIRKILSME